MITSFYQNRSFNPPYNYPNAFHNSPTGLYRPTMESSMSSQPNQPYSPINPTNLDMNFEELIFSQDYNYSQDYSMTRAKKDEPKEPPKDWTMAEEPALCQTWCDVSENNIDGNSMKSKGFWDAVIRYFEKESGSSRGYDSIVSKRKIRVHPRIGAFCAIINNVEENHESGTNDLYVYHKGRKKCKTSETTSGSASGGLNLNEEVDEAVEETQEFQPIGKVILEYLIASTYLLKIDATIKDISTPFIQFIPLSADPARKLQPVEANSCSG
ncbi:hypothetical protein Tco_1353624, partial [Tanacetum coccineum]